VRADTRHSFSRRVGFKLLASGSRQIISFPIAGDIVGLRSVLLRTADHSFSAITDAVVSAVDGAQVSRSATEFPRLGAALLWATSRDEAMVVRAQSSALRIFAWSLLSD
jgi:CRP-like cAMP-binding protein